MIDEVSKISNFEQIKSVEETDLIETIGEDFDQKYIDAIVSLALDKEAITQGNDIKMKVF